MSGWTIFCLIKKCIRPLVSIPNKGECPVGRPDDEDVIQWFKEFQSPIRGNVRLDVIENVNNESIVTSFNPQ